MIEKTDTAPPAPEPIPERELVSVPASMHVRLITTVRYDPRSEENIETLSHRLTDIIKEAAGNGLITDDLGAFMDEMRAHVVTDGLHIAAVALATETSEEDWVFEDGPCTGVGDERWIVGRDASPAAGRLFYVCLDDDRYTVEEHTPSIIVEPGELRVVPWADQIDARARDLYNEYCLAVGGHSWDGKALPSWEIFKADTSKQKQVEGWIAVAHRSMRMPYHAIQPEPVPAGILDDRAATVLRDEIRRHCAPALDAPQPAYNGDKDLRDALVRHTNTDPNDWTPPSTFIDESVTAKWFDHVNDGRVFLVSRTDNGITVKDMTTV